MAMRFGWWRASLTRIDFVVPVIEPPIGIALASLKDEAVRIVITSSVFPEKKYSYAHYIGITANSYRCPPRQSPRQLFAPN
jgi:hypothetical protein